MPLPQEVALHDVEKVWPQAFGTLRANLGPRRLGLLREAVPGRMVGGILEFWVPEHMGFHLDRLQSDESVAESVMSELERLLGVRVGIAFASRPDAGGTGLLVPVVDDAAGELPDKDRLDEAPSDLADPARLLQDELGAKIIDEVEY